MKTAGFLADIVRDKLAPTPKKRVFTLREQSRISEQPKQESFLPEMPKAVKGDPCAGCPAQGRPQTLPTFPEHCDLVLIDDRVPDAPHLTMPEHTKALLARAGIDPERIGLATITRCRTTGPVHGDEWKKMAKHCEGWLRRDLPSGAALLVQGDESTYAIIGSRDHGAAYWRGLWFRSALDDRRAFCVQGNDRLEEDLARCGRTLKGDPPQLRTLEIVTDPRERPELMRWLAEHPGPWGFDIECFDAGAFPSRESVVFDACHPDYRLRGIAIAWSEDEGVWLETAPLGPEIWKPFLDPVFLSPAEKGGHNAHTDEDGMVMTGYVSGIHNRKMDSMLTWNALSDGRHASLRLERLAVDVLQQDQYWGGFEKSQMRDAPLDLVARGAVFDAAMSLWLCLYGAERATAGEYWDGQ